MEKWQNFYSVYSVSCPCVVKLFNSSELHQNSKFWFEIDSPAPLCDSTIYLACSALWDCAVLVLVALWTRRACASAVESLLFSAASWQFGEHLWMFWTISWIFRGHSWKLHFEANYLSLEAAEDVQPDLNKFSTSQRVPDILAAPTGSSGKKFFISETISMIPSGTTALCFESEHGMAML